MRVAIVCDEKGTWYVRRIRVVEYDLDANEKVYRCDSNIGVSFTTPEAAVAAAKQAIYADEAWGGSC